MKSVSIHFQVEELAEGIFAAIAKQGGAVGNAGFVDLGKVPTNGYSFSGLVD